MTILIHFNDKNDIPQTYTISGTSQDLNNELQKFKKDNNFFGILNNLKYIESKGYEVPKHIYKGKLVASIGEKIVIKTIYLINVS